MAGRLQAEVWTDYLGNVLWTVYDGDLLAAGSDAPSLNKAMWECDDILKGLHE